MTDPKVLADALDCFIWKGQITKEGYARKWIRGRMQRLNRVAWEWANGPVPDGMIVCHTCDNRACVNPDHLFLGTNADNSADMVAKGRSARGENHSQARLTDDDARAILNSDETSDELAARFGVTRSTINRVRARTHWRHL